MRGGEIFAHVYNAAADNGTTAYTSFVRTASANQPRPSRPPAADERESNQCQSEREGVGCQKHDREKPAQVKDPSRTSWAAPFNP